MRVNIDEIREAGIERSWDLAREELDEAVRRDPAGYRAREALRVEARLEKLGRRVMLEAHARAGLTCPCGRCLEPVSLDVPVDFELTLVPAAEEPGVPGGEGRGEGVRERARVAGSFAPEEADEEPYSGKVIDLDALVREQVLLALPAYPVCGEACKGLCPACGANRNERECGCDSRAADPRWAALRNVKL